MSDKLTKKSLSLMLKSSPRPSPSSQGERSSRSSSDAATGSVPAARTKSVGTVLNRQNFKKTKRKQLRSKVDQVLADQKLEVLRSSTLDDLQTNWKTSRDQRLAENVRYFTTKVVTEKEGELMDKIKILKNPDMKKKIKAARRAAKRAAERAAEQGYDSD